MLTLITQEIIEELAMLRLDVGHLWQLEQLLGEDGKQVEKLVNTLERKGYIFEGSITPMGRKLWEDMRDGKFSGKKREKPSMKAVAEAEALKFEEWWKVYPGTDIFDWKGKSFVGSQSKRKDKLECAVEFITLCKTYSADVIIRATLTHISIAKEVSYKKGENQLTYIPNSLRYLKEKRFVEYIGKSVVVEKIEKNGGELIL